MEILLPGGLGSVIGRASTNIETIIRVQALSYELFFQCSTMLPDALRIKLSRPLAAIRDAQAAGKSTPPQVIAGAGTAGTGAEAVTELTRLASLLDAGLLTREEFDGLKARLLAGS